MAVVTVLLKGSRCSVDTVPPAVRKEVRDDCFGGTGRRSDRAPYSKRISSRLGLGINIHSTSPKEPLNCSNSMASLNVGLFYVENGYN